MSDGSQDKAANKLLRSLEIQPPQYLGHQRSIVAMATLISCGLQTLRCFGFWLVPWLWSCHSSGTITFHLYSSMRDDWEPARARLFRNSCSICLKRGTWRFLHALKKKVTLLKDIIFGIFYNIGHFISTYMYTYISPSTFL